MKRKALILLLGILIAGIPKIAQAQFSSPSKAQDTTLPNVFILGEYEELYEKTVPEYDLLLNVCDHDMELAFEKWLSMMVEMEAYAKKVGFDLNGVKAWIHVFWDVNGAVNHIGYHLKPNSKNVDNEKLSAFLSDFINHYRFPHATDVKYAHYTTVAFPVFYKRVKN